MIIVFNLWIIAMLFETILRAHSQYFSNPLSWILGIEICQSHNDEILQSHIYNISVVCQPINGKVHTLETVGHLCVQLSSLKISFSRLKSFGKTRTTPKSTEQDSTNKISIEYMNSSQSPSRKILQSRRCICRPIPQNPFIRSHKFRSQRFHLPF